MDKKNKKALSVGAIIIASAVIWGAVIIGCSLVLKGTDCYGEIQNILVAGTFTHIILLGGTSSAVIFKSAKKEK